MNYMYEEYFFPSDLLINADFKASQYGEELKKCTTQLELDRLLKKWMYLCPELKDIHPHLETVLQTVHDFKKQCQLIELSQKGDQEAYAVLNAVIPPTLLRYDMMAHELNVPLGVFLLQLLDSGDIPTNLETENE